MTHSCFQMGRRILEFQELGGNIQKRERESPCYERREAHHFISFKGKKS